MRALFPFCAAAVLLATSDVAAQSASIAATVTVRPRASVTPSARVIEFVVPEGGASAEATLEFAAGARAMPAAPVVLLLEADGIAAPGPHAGDSAGEIGFEGEGPGLLRGSMSADGRAVLARWTGGGLRHGRVRLVLRAAAPGVYRMPVRLAVAHGF